MSIDNSSQNTNFRVFFNREQPLYLNSLRTTESCLFPFNSGRRFGGKVIQHPIDALDLTHDAAGNSFQ